VVAKKYSDYTILDPPTHNPPSHKVSEGLLATDGQASPNNAFMFFNQPLEDGFVLSNPMEQIQIANTKIARSG